MVFVIKNVSQGVIEDGAGFVKTDSVLLEIGRGLPFIPFK
jgi:hypothetical protein